MEVRVTRVGLDFTIGFEDELWFEEVVSERWTTGDAGMVLNLFLRVSSPLAPAAVRADDVRGRLVCEVLCATVGRELFVAELNAVFVELAVFCWLLSPFETCGNGVLLFVGAQFVVGFLASGFGTWFSG